MDNFWWNFRTINMLDGLVNVAIQKALDQWLLGCTFSMERRE